ncbi:hypothetical protein TREMEDRAFT_67197 [Tremella mesenterica DSM 1558]|uniref:uncharacterized protein n=1 Tax=Tremella mesenterica (strain ATCC 24925 / CBS 8224 / DSM 1558 / NBRC 9311 / NRRL Y-6157 / RJB 2259-6 / UBC 559-6) TaxID=578456 RepID=UPI0003F49459|nr:uncharacterized protein TREMEDRAFT_67197 [Tremella mesenterica DSM 1558]EIW73078.1 hypothetical protein TREMEDRAFT_67197 [Tremella mesenterica DSM 1558]
MFSNNSRSNLSSKQATQFQDEMDLENNTTSPKSPTLFNQLRQRGGTGDEPGVDVRSKRDEEAYGHLKGPTRVTVVDYSSDPDEGTDVRVGFPGGKLDEWLNLNGVKMGEGSTQKGVRWIHIDGINWEVVKTLTLRFNLHPLAVEDALRATNSPRSKLDFYKSHMYMQLLIQHTHLSDENTIAAESETMKDGHLSKMLHDSSAGKKGWFGAVTGSQLQLPEGVEGVFEPVVAGTRLQEEQSPYQKAAHRLTVDHLSAKYMVPVRRGVLSVFMTRDNTLISMCRRPIHEALEPIYRRLEDDQSLLRRSGDVSMLAQALLDVSADLAIEISQTFESEILKLEASVLVDPQMETVRHLHILSSQLIRLRRSISPLLHVCYIIRDQDVQRAAAAAAMAGHRSSDRGTGQNSHPSRDTLQPQAAPWLSSLEVPSRPVSPGMETGSIRSFIPQNPVPFQGQGVGQSQQGFFSPMSKVYIGDVLDHLELIVGSMDQFVATCDHLTDYVFNALSFETNASMERLSIVTVVFLPLTFIASYFGMNFDGFSELHGSVSYFWKVAIPCTLGFFITFSFSYLRTGAETLGRKLFRWQRMRMVEYRLRGRRGSAQSKTDIRR